MNTKLILSTIILLGYLLLSGAVIYAEEGHQGGHAETSPHAADTAGHEEGGEHSTQEGGFTVWYLIYWAGLAGLLALTGKFLLEASKKGISGVEVVDNNMSLVCKLVLLALFIYGIDQFASMKHYHEASIVGFLRFLLKMAAGVAMMVYSFSGLEEHGDHH